MDILSEQMADREVSAIVRRGGSAGVSPREFLTAGIIMLSFTALFVTTRIAANLRRGQTMASDSEFRSRY